MYPKSIFDLPRKKEDLISANQGMSNLYYDEIASLRNIIDSGSNVNNFGNGLISFRWHPASGSWWIPSRSYFRIDCELTKPNGTDPLVLDDRIAVNMGAASCLFSKQQYKINDKTISEISEHVAQVDAIKTRLRRSGRWLETTGANLNCWGANVQERLRKTSRDGHKDGDINLYTSLTSQETVAQTAPSIIDNAADTVAFDYDNGNAGESSFDFVDNAGNNLRFGTRVGSVGEFTPTVAELNITNLRPGDVVSYVIQNKQYQGTILRFRSVGADNAGVNRIIITRHQVNIVLGDVGAANIDASALATALQLRKVLNPLAKDRQVKNFSLIYQPPLSIFGVSHAIPGSSKHEIDLVPFSDTVYQKNFIESLFSDKVHTTDGANNDFRFKVTNMLFYAARCDGPIVEKDEFFLDLEETRAQIATITSASRTQFSLDISPATHAITIAFQDESVENNTLFSQSKFKIKNEDELKLTNFYVRYSGIQKPQPDYRPVYDEVSNTDRLVEQYGRSVLYNGSYYDSSTETLEQYRERGIYLHWPWPKTGTDRETRVYVSTQFSSLTGQPRLVLFNHFNKVCILKYENGSLSQVIVNEV